MAGRYDSVSDPRKSMNPRARQHADKAASDARHAAKARKSGKKSAAKHYQKSAINFMNRARKAQTTDSQNY